MASQSGIGQQVTQRTTQHDRPQIRVVVIDRQVVNAYQDDRVQGDDLAQKHYLLFGTHGTEHMPRSAVVVALRVSIVFCVFLHLFFCDGGGGEALCCPLVCHRSNEAMANARLIFIVDEGLGFDSAVEFGGVAVPFHQSLRSSAHLAPLQYRLHAVHFIGGYLHLLQLRFVEGSVQHFIDIVYESVDGWIGGMNLVCREDLFAPIRCVRTVS